MNLESVCLLGIALCLSFLLAFRANDTIKGKFFELVYLVSGAIAGMSQGRPRPEREPRKRDHHYIYSDPPKVHQIIPLPPEEPERDPSLDD